MWQQVSTSQRLAVGWEFFQYAGPADLLRPGSILAHPSGCTSVHLGNSGKNQSGARYQETPEVFGLLGSLPCSLMETVPLARRQESPKEEHSLTWFQYITRRIHFVQYFTLDGTAKRISKNNTVGKCITEHAFETSLHMPAESWAFVKENNRTNASDRQTLDLNVSASPFKSSWAGCPTIAGPVHGESPLIFMCVS